MEDWNVSAWNERMVEVLTVDHLANGLVDARLCHHGHLLGRLIDHDVRNLDLLGES